MYKTTELSFYALSTGDEAKVELTLSVKTQIQA